MLLMYSAIQTFIFLKYDWSGLDIIDVREGKKVGGEREKKTTGSKTFMM